MNEKIEFPDKEELIRLSRASIALYAIRCALRVQPLLVYPGQIFFFSNDYQKAVLELKYVLDENFSKTPEASKVSTAFELAKAIHKLVHDMRYNLAVTDDMESLKPLGVLLTTAESIKNALRVPKSSTDEESVHYALKASNNITGCPGLQNAARADYELFVKSDSPQQGSLWHGETPDWYWDAKEQYEETIQKW